MKKQNCFWVCCPSLRSDVRLAGAKSGGGITMEETEKDT